MARKDGWIENQKKVLTNWQSQKDFSLNFFILWET
jgi:hypothetical protein